MNTPFYEEFEDFTLKAFKLDHLKQEDFEFLKRLDIKRHNIRQLNRILTADSDFGSEASRQNPYKELKDHNKIIEEIVNTKSTNKNSVLCDDPKTYTELINVYRK